MKSKNTHKLTAWSFFIAIVGIYFIMAAKFPLAYIVATYEDMVGEWAQVFLFTATMLLSIGVARYKSSYRLFFAVLALACFYVIGEEISWGQRIFNLTTPEFFETHNLQNETNLHNFFTGPISTTLKQSLEYLIALGLVVYGLLYPLLITARWKLALWFNNNGLPYPPLYLWPFFVLSAYLELGFINFNEAEIAEILIPLALAIMATNYLLALRKQQDLKNIADWQASESKKLAYQTTTLVLTVTLLAFSTTAVSYASSNLSQKIESRYLNGVEKFANRYKRFEQWESAAQLYLLALEKDPQQAEILRNLFICYSGLNDKQKARTFLKKAEQLEIDFLAREPLRVDSHLSLVETYELSGNQERASDHLRGSLDIAKLNARRSPDNASSAYWLGRAEEKNGNFNNARQQYQRATQLRPGFLRYQKALLNLNRHKTD
jgi:tetratricopeptide (TPR) repeat protein